MVNVYLTVYGCSSNVADYEIASGLLKQAGFKIVDNPKKSDVNIIFTCVVKFPTVNKMISKIKKLTETNRYLIVAGCMTKTDRKTIEKINPNASMIGPDSIEKIVDVVNFMIQNKKVIFLGDLRKPKVCLPKLRKNQAINIIPISIGCLGNCSYCSVKFARGKLFSYPTDLIVKEAKQAIQDGCKELWITSEDNGCYGVDIETSLASILSELVEINGKFFIRVGMMNPSHINSILDRLIDVYSNEKIFKFLHLPIQSFSPKVLEAMKRGYQPQTAIDIVDRFYKQFINLTFSTDIIVGFPGETDSDFEETLKFIEKIKPDIVNISKFGAHPFTEAAKLKQLMPSTIRKRSKELFELSRKISLEKNQRWLDWKGEILIDEKGIKNGTWVGRNFAYKPIIIHGKNKLLGKFMNVKVIDAKSNYLIGKLV